MKFVIEIFCENFGPWNTKKIDLTQKADNQTFLLTFSVFQNVESLSNFESQYLEMKALKKQTEMLLGSSF